MKKAELSLRDIDVLFSPYSHRKLKLRTRLVMAPLPRLFSQNGVPTPEMVLYYQRRAQNMVGLIITEPVAVNDPAAAADSGMAHFYGGAALRAWRRICRAVHARACSIVPQLHHVGMLRPLSGDIPHPEASPIGPSGIDPISGEKRAEEMSPGRISSVLAAFATAARSARLLGFDGVEINGSSGGLVEQFLRKETNNRMDEYGGDMMRRARFACQVVQAVRKETGRTFPVIFRFSQQGCSIWNAPLLASPAELEELLAMLCEAGVDFFACDGAGVPAFPGSALSLAGWIHMLVNRPVITDGGIGLPSVSSSADLAWHLRSCQADLIAVGRALLADAEWGTKVHMGREHDIIPFTQRAWMHLF